MFRCKRDEDEGFTITKPEGGVSQIRVEYFRKAYSELYISCAVPQQNIDRGVNTPNPEVKELMSKRYYSIRDISNKLEMHEEIKDEVNKQNLPNDINPASDGIQIEELDRETFREKLINNIVREELGKGNQMPGIEEYIRQKAEKVADKILDEDKEYNVAKEEVFGSKEPGGPTPDKKREH